MRRPPSLTEGSVSRTLIVFALPLLAEDDHSEPAARRRRHNAIRARRPKFLVRRRGGNLNNTETIHREEREIIARD